MKKTWNFEVFWGDYLGQQNGEWGMDEQQLSI
jgi:hypothetical protein